MSLIATAGARRRTPPYPTSAPYNMPTHLTIPTYDGSNQPVHIDVIDFQNEGITGGMWHGWRFWMVMTPYPNYSADYEDPSLVVSNDGIYWQVPAGLTNPLYRPLEGPYNNDPDMVYDPDADEIVLWYRDYNVMKRARSADGTTWPATATTVGASAVSPAFVRDSTGTWHMWVGTQHYTAPAAEGPYTSMGATTGLTNVWHRNMVEAPGGGFHMIYHDDSTGQKNIKVASSSDGTAWTTNTTPVLMSGTHDWSSGNVYRPGFTLHEDGDRYRVWYSGVGTDPDNPFRSAWRTGYTEIPLTEWPAIT